ncbi:DUF6409 family protein [Streptomyces sp. NPDC048516]|uniref:DUF6409 family protein n=1 Tax=Streptomyces sp. NPDC048516 TaxID=3365565 RepID=UPI00371CEE77
MTATIETGTIVRCPKRVDGQIVGTRKAVVLGLFNPNDPNSGYGVWFYTAGPADTGTLTLAFERELTPVGTIEDMSERTLLNLERDGRNFSGAHALRMKASTLRLRKASARRGY